MKQRPNKKASIRELALELGVSTATVSRALNNNPSVSEETRTRVLELADQAGLADAELVQDSDRHVSLQIARS